jgi:3-phenylpropionate/trans-cinnamate dioxygenase ferredoxin subunit
MADVTIKILPKGPYLVTGPIQLTNADGSPVAIPEGRPMVALCRCGASVTKPFCDGTHSKIGFDAAEKAVADGA